VRLSYYVIRARENHDVNEACDRKRVLDHLEASGLSIDGGHIRRPKIKEMLYRAQAFSMISELEKHTHNPLQIGPPIRTQS